MKKLLVSLVSAVALAAGAVYSTLPSQEMALQDYNQLEVQTEMVRYELEEEPVRHKRKHKVGFVNEERALSPCEKSKQWLGTSIEDYIKETAPGLLNPKTNCPLLWKLAEQEQTILWYGGICDNSGEIRGKLYEEMSIYSKSCRGRSLAELMPKVNVSKYTTFLLKYLNSKKRQEEGYFPDQEGEVDLTMHVLKGADEIEREEIIEERCSSELHIFTTPYHLENIDGSLVQVRHYDGRVLCREILKQYPDEFSQAIDFEDSSNITPILELSDFSFFVKHGLNKCLVKEGLDQYSPFLLVGDKNYFAKEVAGIICDHANQTGFDKIDLFDLYLANLYDRIGVDLDIGLIVMLQNELNECTTDY